VDAIRNEHEYEQALKLAARLVDADPARGTTDGDRLEMLATLIERYEAKHFPLDPPRASVG